MAYKYRKTKLKDGTTRDEHVLIMESILNRPLFDCEVVHHKDENGKNNSIDNLVVMFSWCHKRMHQLGKTFSSAQKEKLSIASRGSNNNRAIIDESIVVKIKILLRDTDKTHKEIAQILSVGLSCVHNISSGYRWKHITID